MGRGGKKGGRGEGPRGPRAQGGQLRLSEEAPSCDGEFDLLGPRLQEGVAFVTALESPSWRVRHVGRYYIGCAGHGHEALSLGGALINLHFNLPSVPPTRPDRTLLPEMNSFECTSAAVLFSPALRLLRPSMCAEPASSERRSPSPAGTHGLIQPLHASNHGCYEEVSKISLIVKL